MSLASVCLADLPGTRPLYADLLGDYASVGRFYPHPPSLDAACTAAADVRMDAVHRRQLVDELSRQNAGGDDETRASLDRLADTRTVVVATGQQVGVLGGPVFTLYKALAAVRCAEEMTRRGVPAVPVFWLATEDHDLPEVDHAWTFDRSARPHRLVARSDGLPGAAVGSVRVLDVQLNEFARLCEGLPRAREAVALARRAYGEPVRYGEGFQALYRELLAGTGIVFLSPMADGVRTLSAPLVRRVIHRASDLSGLLLRRGLGLESAGYHQQVHTGPSTTLLMLFERSARVPLKRSNGCYWSGDASFSSADLLARLERAPVDLSPTALLRPVLQDYLLPTAALVVGPSEAAYLAQSAVLYENLLGRMPAVLPRASFTVVGSSSRKLLRRYRMTVSDCWVPRDTLAERIAAELVPTHLQGNLERHSDDIAKSLQGMRDALQRFDPTLAESFRRSSRKIEYQLGKIRSKAGREALRRSATARRHVARLGGSLFPKGHLQERLYSVLGFIARFGMDFVDRASAAAEPGCLEHRVLEA